MPCSSRMSVAEIAAERMEELARTASLRDAGTTAGIATDKLLALSSDPLSQANNHLHVHLESVNLIEQFNEMVASLPHAKTVSSASNQPIADVRDNASVDASLNKKQSVLKELPERRAGEEKPR